VDCWAVKPLDTPKGEQQQQQQLIHWKKNEYKEEEEFSLKQIRNGRWRARILKNETDPSVVCPALAKNTDPNSFHSFLFYPLRNKALNPPTSYRPTPSEECEGVAKK
jgi:hypothetical protein